MFQYIDYNMHKKNEWPVEQVETKSTTLQEIQIPINQKIETSPLYFFPITHNFVDIAKYCLELEDQDEGKTGYDKKEKPLLLREVTQSITWPNTLLLHFNLGCQTAYTQSKYTSIDYQFSDAENWIIDLSTAKKPCKYQLESFIVHSGHILQAGHYYTIRREENFNGEKQWIEYNDGHSSLVSPKEIANFLHGKKGSTTPYLMTLKKIYI